jgi:hypothetical protein
MLLSDPTLRRQPLASSLGLHLHRVGRTTSTSKLLSMPSTHTRGGRYACARLRGQYCEVLFCELTQDLD